MRRSTCFVFSVPSLVLLFCLIAGISFVPAYPATADAPDAAALYSAHCASCHGAGRLGGIGPALLPENLGRLPAEKAVRAIREGLPATQMPGFAGTLDATQIQALVDYVFTPLPEVPRWEAAAIEASRVVHNRPGALGEAPVHDADPLNLFVVVETGDHHVTLLDGDRFEPVHRFKSRYALHGGAKFSPDGRFTYLASRDGWVSKFDLYTLKPVAEVRAGINTRNIAASSDGRYVMVANYLPHTLVVLDAADLKPLRIIAVEDERGRSSRVSAVYDAPPRESFIAALKDITEVWEISYADDPPYYGKVHDYRYEGPPKVTERFPVRRIRLDDYLDDFFFDPEYQHLIGTARNARNGQVVNLLVGRKIADIDLSGMPHLGSGITWRYGEKSVLATPNLREPLVSVVDMQRWKTIRRIETQGPGFFMRSHENTRYAWVDVFFGPHRDVVHVIDKDSLEIVQTLRPAPGKTAAHVEFTRDGRYALVSIWDMDGAVVVYDAQTLEEVKRIPMVKPSGKYNVYNKITRSRGTSH
ncbi:MAG: cytochrome C oxidase Cbb3 [Gammaproteobacteria bacterium]|nr:cytochrome C oxidase Cbb3 [Gammaproteobacteria bacterium]NIR83502.1 cytochrome C oxidase Cbb3 [Gammaproteobacteria bacterium]NIR91424.1 cytochrome C oxidase Cbb3 [Gammaproteobacteria bacterium]NIU04664.1 cytochrome C oxidase Cbb3 [Gammaproteobacteria bacterium]NIV51706.1 cytochrome C oxidase Cbb3 [Gammaproteobacteria bacterium]